MPGLPFSVRLSHWLLVLMAGLCCGMAAFAQADGSSYYPLNTAQLPWQAALEGPLDQSLLNRPLVNADRIAVHQGHFFKVGGDGLPGTADDQRVRLYGTNLTYNANFPAPDQARTIARRLRSLGFNAVRLHHLDSQPDDGHGSTNSILMQGPFPTFNPKAVDALKAFLAALKAEGIYANLNLYVGYRFSPEKDQLPPLADGEAALPPGSAAQVFYPQLVQLQARYAQALIRQLGLADDPQLAMVEIRNESSLASAWQAWGRSEWTSAVQGAYGQELTRQWNQWLNQTYGSVANACAQWQSCTQQGAQPLVSPDEADGLRTGQRAGFMARLIDKLRAVWVRWTAWLGWNGTQHGGSIRSRRLYDFARFITDTDQRYFDELKRAVQSVTRTSLPVTGTQLGYGGDMNLLSQRGMDYLDDHFYIDHYDFPHAPWDANDWRIKDSALSAAEIRSLGVLAQRRDARRPFVVSEYNQAYPNRQGQGLMPAVALLAALQDWDGLFHFDYADGDHWALTPSGFRLSGDWAKLAVTGPSAQLFRSGLVPPLPPGNGAVDPERILAAAAERRREGRGADTVPPPLLFGAANPQVRYTGEEERLVFHTTQVAGFVGQVTPGQPVSVGDLTFDPLVSRAAFATVVISSLDGAPLSGSTRLLLSLPGHVMGSHPGSLPARPKRLVPYQNSPQWWTLEPDATGRGGPSGSREATGPVWMARSPFKLIWRHAGDAPTVYPLSLAGQRLQALPTVKVADGFEMRLQVETAPQSPWYEVVFDKATQATNR